MTEDYGEGEPVDDDETLHLEIVDNSASPQASEASLKRRAILEHCRIYHTGYTVEAASISKSGVVYLSLSREGGTGRNATIPAATLKAETNRLRGRSSDLEKII